MSLWHSHKESTFESAILVLVLSSLCNDPALACRGRRFIFKNATLPGRVRVTRLLASFRFMRKMLAVVDVRGG
jgi:hypothetical protein